MPAILHALEILPHIASIPGTVTGKLRNLVPIVIVRINQNHRVVRRAAAQSACPWIENSVAFCRELRVIFLALIAVVMAYEEIPLERIVFRSKGGNGGDWGLFR